MNEDLKKMCGKIKPENCHPEVVVGRVEFDRAHGLRDSDDSLPPEWRSLYDAYKFESIKYCLALTLIRDMAAGTGDFEDDAVTRYKIYNIAQQALEMGGEDEKR